MFPVKKNSSSDSNGLESKLPQPNSRQFIKAYKSENFRVVTQNNRQFLNYYEKGINDPETRRYANQKQMEWYKLYQQIMKTYPFDFKLVDQSNVGSYYMRKGYKSTKWGSEIARYLTDHEVEVYHKKHNEQQKTEIKSLKQTIIDHQAEIAKLKSQNNTLVTQLSTEESSTQQIQSSKNIQIQQTMVEIIHKQDLNQQISVSEANMVDLTNQLEEQKLKYEKKLNQQRINYDKLHHEFEKYKNMLDSKIIQSENQKKIIKELKLNVISLENQIKDVNHNKKKKIGQLQKSIQQLKLNNFNLEVKNSNLITQKIHAEKQIFLKQKQNDMLFVNDFIEKINNQSAQIQRLKRQNQQNIEEIVLKLQKSESEASYYKKQIQSEIKKNEEKEQQLRCLNQEIKINQHQNQSKLNLLRSEICQIKQKCHALELQKQKIMRQKIIQQKQMKIKQKQAELSYANRLISETQKSSAQLNLSRQELIARFQKSQNSLKQSYKKSSENASRQIQRCNLMNQNLNEKITILIKQKDKLVFDNNLLQDLELKCAKQITKEKQKCELLSQKYHQLNISYEKLKAKAKRAQEQSKFHENKFDDYLSSKKIMEEELAKQMKMKQISFNQTFDSGLKEEIKTLNLRLQELQKDNLNDFRSNITILVEKLSNKEDDVFKDFQPILQRSRQKNREMECEIQSLQNKLKQTNQNFERVIRNFHSSEILKDQIESWNVDVLRNRKMKRDLKESMIKGKMQLVDLKMIDNNL